MAGIRNIAFGLGFQGGIIVFCLYVVNFFVLNQLGLTAIPLPRIMYPIIFATVSFFYCRKYKQRLMAGTSFFPGFYFGYILTLSSILPFTIFLYLYLAKLNPDLLKSLYYSLPEAHHFSWTENMLISVSPVPAILFVELFIMGIGISFLMLILRFRQEIREGGQ